MFDGKRFQTGLLFMALLLFRLVLEDWRPHVGACYPESQRQSLKSEAVFGF